MQGMTGQTRFSQVLLLVNPRSGSAGDATVAFQHELEARGVQVQRRELEKDVSCAHYLSDLNKYQALVVAGGDGTVSSFAYAARNKNVPFLAYPAGTANLIAQNLHLPTDPKALADVLLSGRTVRVDLAELEIAGDCTGFALVAGAGADAAMIRDSEDLKPQLGTAAYVVSALKQIAPTRHHFTLTLDGERREVEGMAVLVANFGMANFRLPITSDIHPADGRLTVIVMHGAGVLSLVPNLIDSLRSKLNLGNPLFGNNVTTYQARSVIVESDEALPVQYDGELHEATTPFTARVLPGAIRFLTPASLEDLAT